MRAGVTPLRTQFHDHKDIVGHQLLHTLRALDKHAGWSGIIPCQVGLRPRPTNALENREGEVCHNALTPSLLGEAIMAW